MKKNWIGIDNTPKFEIQLWNHHNNFQDRTNNKIEGWHTGFNLNKAPHPNIYKFIQSIMDVQMKNDVLVSAMMNGEKPISRARTKYILINQRLVDLTTKLNAGQITVATFLEFASRLLKS